MIKGHQVLHEYNMYDNNRKVCSPSRCQKTKRLNLHGHTHTHTHLFGSLLPQSRQSSNIVTHCSPSRVMLLKCSLYHLLPSFVALASEKSTTCNPPGSVSAVTLNGSFLNFFSHRLALPVLVFFHGVESSGGFYNEG